jgi:hypothetical protein
MIVFDPCQVYTRSARRRKMGILDTTYQQGGDVQWLK